MKSRLKLLAAWALLTLAVSLAYAAQGIREFKSDSLQRIVAEQKGKPFVLVVWSLDCSFCQTSLDNLVAEQRRRKDLRIVTLSTDTLGDRETMAASVKRLQALGLTNNAWAFGDEPPEHLRYALDPRWHGEKPRSYWFNAKGEKTAYSGVITPPLIDKFMPER
jgi:hypothetical protein